MSRSKWKGPYIPNNKNNKSKSSEITPKFIDKTFKIHSGKKITELNITEEMIGYKLGEFINTRAIFEFKKKKKK